MPTHQHPTNIGNIKLNAMIQTMVQHLTSMGRDATVLQGALRLIARVRQTFTRPIISKHKFNIGTPPSSSEYNHVMQEAQADLSVMAAACDLQKLAITRDYNYAKTENLLLINMVTALEDSFRDVMLYHDAQSADIIARDSFVNASKIDYGRIAGVPVDVNTSQQLVTLKQIGHTEQQEAAMLQVIPGPIIIEDTYGLLGNESNGFAGSTHEIMINPVASENVATSELEKYMFVGADNAHCNLADILDGSPDTWFEYELVNVPESEKRRVGGFGFAYDAVIDGAVKQIRWDREPEDGSLRLHLAATFDKPREINWISVRLCTPPNRGAQVCRISDIRIAPDDLVTARSIMGYAKQARSNMGDMVFMFEPTPAKVVHLYFEQPRHFPVAVGHIYHKHMVTTQTERRYLFGLIEGKTTYETTETRIDGPNLPIETTGAQVTASPGEVIGGALVNIGALTYGLAQVGVLALSAGPVGLGLAVIGLVIAGLSTKRTSVVSSEVQSGIEPLEGGWRYAIGISDIAIKSAHYAEQSELISIPYITPKPIRALYLETDDWHPPDYGDGSWIAYYFTVDDGATWHPISPRGAASLDMPEYYHINPRTLFTIGSQNLGYVATEDEAHEIRLRIVINRPDEEHFTMTTPLVYGYTLHIVTD